MKISMSARKIKLQMQISVDGYVAGTNGEQDWKTLNQDNKLEEFTNYLVDSSDLLLMGRKISDGFITHWENVLNNPPDSNAAKSLHWNSEFAKKMVDIPKIIFSKTLDKPIGKNTSIEKGNLAEEIAKLKNQNGKDILVYGGAGFVSSLVAGGHIDEFNFFVNPVMINKGMRIFDSLDKRQKLSLITATPYECGVTVIRYKLNNE